MTYRGMDLDLNGLNEELGRPTFGEITRNKVSDDGVRACRSRCRTCRLFGRPAGDYHVPSVRFRT